MANATANYVLRLNGPLGTYDMNSTQWVFSALLFAFELFQATYRLLWYCLETSARMKEPCYAVFLFCFKSRRKFYALRNKIIQFDKYFSEWSWYQYPESLRHCNRPVWFENRLKSCQTWPKDVYLGNAPKKACCFTFNLRFRCQQEWPRRCHTVLTSNQRPEKKLAPKPTLAGYAWISFCRQASCWLTWSQGLIIYNVFALTESGVSYS